MADDPVDFNITRPLMETIVISERKEDGVTKKTSKELISQLAALGYRKGTPCKVVLLPNIPSVLVWYNSRRVAEMIFDPAELAVKIADNSIVQELNLN